MPDWAAPRSIDDRNAAKLPCYGEDAKKSQLTSELFYKDEAGRMNETVITADDAHHADVWALVLPSGGGGACFHQISVIQANLQTTTNDVMDVCKLSVLVGLTYSLESVPWR